MLAARSAELNRLIEEKAQPAAESLRTLGQTAAEDIRSAAEQGAALMRGENAALVDAISSRTQEATRALGDSEQSLRATALSLIDALGQSNAGLRQLVADAAANLGAIDETLTSTAGRFSDSAARASDSVTAAARLLEGNAERLSSVSSDTLGQIGQLVAASTITPRCSARLRACSERRSPTSSRRLPNARKRCRHWPWASSAARKTSKTPCARCPAWWKPPSTGRKTAPAR